jgi:hypothetical protein
MSEYSMITPALLILAAGSLVATALVRLARVVDRVWKLVEAQARWGHLRSSNATSGALLAERAVLLYFLAVVGFVVAGVAIAIDHVAGIAWRGCRCSSRRSAWHS